MNPHLLRSALEDCIGKTMTPELALWVERVAGFEADVAIDPAQFEPVRVDGGYVIQAESLRDAVDELHELHQQHWLETEKHRHGLQMRPDYAAMARSERAGRLLQFTVRHDDDGMVGNLRLYIHTSAHTQTRFSEEDTLFVLPAHRGALLGLKLCKYAEMALWKLGVKEIRSNSKLVNHADVLMKRMRYQPVATQFVKIMTEEPHHVL
jgi:GNAT superfamily N-acetyltransferase